MALAEVTVQQSAANAADGSAFYELTAQYNDLAERFEALLQKLDTDFAAQNGAVAGSQLDVDYESGVGESKKIVFSETGAPTAS